MPNVPCLLEYWILFNSYMIGKKINSINIQYQVPRYGFYLSSKLLCLGIKILHIELIVHSNYRNILQLYSILYSVQYIQYLYNLLKLNHQYLSSSAASQQSWLFLLANKALTARTATIRSNNCITARVTLTSWRAVAIDQ